MAQPRRDVHVSQRIQLESQILRDQLEKESTRIHDILIEADRERAKAATHINSLEGEVKILREKVSALQRDATALRAENIQLMEENRQLSDGATLLTAKLEASQDMLQEYKQRKDKARGGQNRQKSEHVREKAAKVDSQAHSTTIDSQDHSTKDIDIRRQRWARSSFSLPQPEKDVSYGNGEQRQIQPSTIRVVAGHKKQNRSRSGSRAENTGLTENGSFDSWLSSSSRKSFDAWGSMDASSRSNSRAENSTFGSGNAHRGPSDDRAWDTKASAASTTVKDEQRSRFFSATEEELEGATVVLLDNTIKSPDFSYFQEIAVSSSSVQKTKEQNHAPKAASVEISHPTGSMLKVRHRQPDDASDVLIEDSDRIGMGGLDKSTVGKRADGGERANTGNNHTTAPRRRLNTPDFLRSLSTDVESVAEDALRRAGCMTDGVGLGDDTKSLLLRLLLAPEMTLVSAILAAVPPRSKTLLLSPLMRVFAAHRKVATLLQWSIDLEVAGTISPATLFRSDSYSSRMLSVFTKNVGRQYLEQILSPTLRIIADNADSVDEQRVSTFELNPDALDDAADPEKVVQNNLQKLIAQVDCVIESVKRSASLLPQSFHHLCRYLSNTVSGRFIGDAGHIAVGSFLFLRFICPALASPDSFGIRMPWLSKKEQEALSVPRQSPAERRSKVLILKLLQKVVSGCPFEAGDTSMEEANAFIMRKHNEVRAFLKELCFPDNKYTMEEAVMNDLSLVQHGDLNTAGAMATVRKLLVQNFELIDAELPPVAFILRRQFREALSTDLSFSRSKKVEQHGGKGSPWKPRTSKRRSSAAKRSKSALDPQIFRNNKRLIRALNDLSL